MAGMEPGWSFKVPSNPRHSMIFFFHLALPFAISEENTIPCSSEGSFRYFSTWICSMNCGLRWEVAVVLLLTSSLFEQLSAFSRWPFFTNVELISSPSCWGLAKIVVLKKHSPERIKPCCCCWDFTTNKCIEVMIFNNVAVQAVCYWIWSVEPVTPELPL